MRLSTYLYLILPPLLWSGNIIFGKVLSSQAEPFTLAFWRWLLATVVLVPLAVWVDGLPIPPKRDWPAFFTLGLTGVFAFNALVYLSLRYTSAVNVLVINAAIPITTLLLVYPLRGERPALRQVAGALLSLLGVGLVMTRGSATALFGLRFRLGDLIMLADTIFWSVYTLVGQQVMARYKPLATTAYAALAGLPFLAVASVAELVFLPPPRLNLLGVIGIAYIGLLATLVAFLSWFAGVAQVGSARASGFTNLMPVFGVAAAAVLLGERVLWSEVVGGGLTILGVFLAAGQVRQRNTEGCGDG